ncbi:fimbrial protein [Citrobacter koseri]|uniref:Fimbrial adhesin n=1 Tax=Citrobacter koseri TaxID=545 RepID=A0A078LFJ1_CITKO|nr:fimbrial protein [Citrobacter koseri]EKV5611128.1 fimbrial protein [Citrobacter koseri]MBJ9243939.1 fimbrial protein [Citrobacter koseri]WEE19070.1 fimbrial protein [Citrobacter koseri]CDZ82864.1 fimbrial adhesin [Citrobacter koseri]SUX62865.1 fimbrial adhesin [Citrobacter koseri]
MSLSKRLTLFIGLMALGTTSAWAFCSRLSQPTVTLDMAIGRVVVPPDLPVGSVIVSRDWTMSASGGASYSCSAGTNRFAAKIVVPGATDLGNKIYSTNVDGIGLRFSRGGATVNIVYPDVYSSYANRQTSYSLEGSRFTLEVIKTANVTGSGTLAAGKYTSYDWENGSNPILETFLSANAITVVSPSCTVLSGKNMNVDIGTIKRSDLNGVGSTAGGKDFNIQLQCSGGVSESGYANIHTTFSGNLATSTTAAQGVLINEKSGNAAAKGIGVQVLKDGTPLEFSKKYNIGTLQTQETRYITLPYRARFYQYASTTSTGEVESHMIFNLTYD